LNEREEDNNNNKIKIKIIIIIKKHPKQRIRKKMTKTLI